MKNRGYSDEFISIFITNDMEQQYDDNKMHEYIGKYNMDYFRDALNEYRNDFHKY